MNKPIEVIGSLSHELLFEVVRACANLPRVREEVLKNHDNNLWWPISVKDWRLRMVIAGWSTRVSYKMISSYRLVVDRVIQVGYSRLCKMPQPTLRKLIMPIGLFTIRFRYLKSLNEFVKKLEGEYKSPLEIPNDDLIELFTSRVEGAQYKVAQCSVLYAKGYHCGIFPVDSGMKDMLGPCLGLHLPKGGRAHEIMRKRIEKILAAHQEEYYDLAMATGYDRLAIPKGVAPTWWVHLVLIYFKRLYCNNRRPELCPLRSLKCEKLIGSMCDHTTPKLGGYHNVVLEGIDQVGKTTLATELAKLGYRVVHSPYNPSHTDIKQHYQALIDAASEPTVFDRSFISEMAYGLTLRGQSRLSNHDFVELLKLFTKRSCVVLYLTDDIDLIRIRIQSHSEEHSPIANHLEELAAEYEKCISQVAVYLPTIRIKPSIVPKAQMVSHILKSIEYEYPSNHHRKCIT